MKQVQFKDLLPGEYFFINETDEYGYSKRRNSHWAEIGDGSRKKKRFADSDCGMGLESSRFVRRILRRVS